MKVLIVGPAYPFRGGIADTNESFCRSLLNKGIEASIITFKLQYPRFLFPGKTQYSSDPAPDDLRIKRMINSINPLNWVLSAYRINKEKPDIVIFRYWLPFMAMSFGSIMRLLRKEIFIIAMCDNIIPHEKRPGDNSLTKYFVKPVDAFITLSNTVLDELNMFTVKPKAYFPHPINDNLGTKISKEEACKKLGLNHEQKFLLFFGLVRKYKGLDLLLQAISHENVRKQNLKLLVVGEFYDSPEEYIKLINDLKIKDNVELHDEYIPTSDIKLYFSAADLVAQTYHTASQSGISQIAFNFDTPILVTNVGGLSEIVVHNKVGYVCEKSPEDIAEKICDFFDNNRKMTFEKNLSIEKQKYTWSAFSDKVLELRERNL